MIQKYLRKLTKQKSLPTLFYHSTGVTTGTGTGALFLAPPVPVHVAVGTGAAVASHALGYGHPATVIIPSALSAGLNHPFPPLNVAVGVRAVKLSVDSVGTGPVAVYVGSNAALATRPIDVGGHWP